MNSERRERLPVSVSSAVFIEDDQKRLLLLQQAAERKGYRWGPSAGGMEPHEDPIMTAIREVEEEIGVKVELIDLIGVYTVGRGDNASGIGFVFRGRIVSGQITPREGEIKDYRFFSSPEIDELISQDMLYKPEYNLSGIQDWLSGRSYPLDAIKRLSVK